MKVSELIEILQKHKESVGDGRVWIYDEYQATHRTINSSHIEPFQGGIAIECEARDE